MRATTKIFLLLLAAALLKHAWLARFCHPMADDWSYAWQGMTKPFLPWLADEYRYWNGRFFSNILVGKGPLVMGLDHLWLYRLVPILLLLGSLVAAWMFVRSLTNDALRPRQQWTGAMMLTVLFVHGMPDLSEGFYWYTGAITYQLGNILLLAELAALIAFVNGRYWLARNMHLVLLILLAAMVIGSSEVHMLIMLALHAFVVLVRMKGLKKLDRPTIILAAAVTVLALIVLLAPGNAERGSNFPHRHQLLHSLWMSLLQTGRFGFEWVTDLSLLLASLLYLPISRDLSRRVKLFQLSFHLSPLLSGVLLMAVIFICVFPAYWSTGILGQHRTVNVAYWCFLPFWFMNLTVVDNAILRRRWNLDLTPRLQLLALAILVLHVHLGRNGGRALSDMLGTARDFDRQMVARYAQLAMPTASEGPILLDPITAVPKTLYLLEIDEDPSWWVNRSYNLYFGTDRPIALAPRP